MEMVKNGKIIQNIVFYETDWIDLNVGIEEKRRKNKTTSKFLA